LLISSLFYLTTFSNVASAATYYLDAVNGNDSNNGSSSSPWKTLAKAQTVVTNGDTVYVRNGDYGAYTETDHAARTNWVTYQADTGHTPIFTKISITNSTQRTTYLKFDGINIQHPSYTPTDDGYWHYDDVGAPGYLVYVEKANYVQFLHGSYKGTYRYISKPVYFLSCDNVTIHHCEVSDVVGDGIRFNGVSVFTCDNCYVHNIINSTGIRVQGTVTSGTITNNHVYSIPMLATDDYYPHLADPETIHPGSGIGLRSSNISIRKNIIRGAFSQGIMTYSGYTYSGLTIENNLFYDTDIINLGYLIGACTIRNNTFCGWVRDNVVGKYDLLQRYKNYVYISFSSPYKGIGTKIYNNVTVGEFSLQGIGDVNYAYEENYNIWWEQGGTNGTQTKNTNDHIAVWLSGPPSYNLMGTFNYFEHIGGSPSQAFFVSPNFYTTCYPNTDNFVGNVAGRWQIWDYHLADGSPGINSGDLDNQPSDSLGTLDSNGFINDNGPPRDANHHSAGCYEYINSKTYSITASAGSGGMISPSGTTQVNSGGTQTYTITPGTGYHIVDVLVDGNSVGAVSNYTFTNVTANHTIATSFTINTYTLTVSSTNGTVTKNPDQAFYDHVAIVSIEATAASNYRFVNWTGTSVTAGKVANPNAAATTINMDADYTIQANFVEEDRTAPNITSLSPEANSIQVPLNNLIILHVVDAAKGVDANSVTITVDNNMVYAGNTADYGSEYGHCPRID
jgi:hypothetical protein